MMFRTGAALWAVSLLTLPAFAAPPPKAAKPAVTKSAGTKAAAAAPAAKPAQKTYRLPTGGKPVAVPPPPAALTTPAPAPAAQAGPAATKVAEPAAQQPAATKTKAPAKSKAKKTAKKTSKKRVAEAKGKKIRQGRSALTPMERIDKGQLATDHLSGAESKSTLELLVSYKETVREGDLETAGVLLRLIANETPNREVVTAVNDLIGARLDTLETEVLIEIARADRARAVAGDAAKKSADEKVASPLGERIHAAHAAVAAAPRTSRIDALAAYKHAVAEGNEQAAMVALSGVVQGPLDDGTVDTANALLGIDTPIGRQASAN